MLRYFCTAPQGTEDLVAKEMSKAGVSVKSTAPGKVFLTADERFTYVGNNTLRTVNRVFIELIHTKFRTLRDIREIAESLSYMEFIKSNATFAVRAERVGTHDFTSIDVGREVGAGIIESYASETGVRLKVNLRRPDVEVHAFVINDDLIIGINTTGTSLHRRRYRVYDHPAALKTTLAAALLELLDYKEGSFLDPMCGGATIVIEAAHRALSMPITLFRQDYAYKKLKLYDPQVERDTITDLLSRIELTKDIHAYCIDASPKHLAGARLNATSANVAWVTTFIEGDSTLRKTYSLVDTEVRYAAVNPPYGIRFHNPKKLPMFYRKFLEVFFERFPEARLALITAAVRALERAADEAGIKIVRRINVMHGGLRARMYLLSS